MVNQFPCYYTPRSNMAKAGLAFPVNQPELPRLNGMSKRVNEQLDRQHTRSYPHPKSYMELVDKTSLLSEPPRLAHRATGKSGTHMPHLLLQYFPNDKMVNHYPKPPARAI